MAGFASALAGMLANFATKAPAGSMLATAATKIADALTQIPENFTFTPPSIGFTFSPDLSKVTSETVTFAGTTKSVDITDSSFTTVVGTNDKGNRSVITVTQQRPDRDEDSTLTAQFGDKDGDGKFATVLSLWVATEQQDLHGHKFTFDAAGKVTGEQAEFFGMYFNDPVKANEVFQKVTLDGKTYVVETEAFGKGFNFSISRDDNSDGVWNTVAAGHADGSFVDPATKALNIASLQTYLASSSSVIG